MVLETSFCELLGQGAWIPWLSFSRFITHNILVQESYQSSSGILQFIYKIKLSLQFNNIALLTTHSHNDDYKQGYYDS